MLGLQKVFQENLTSLAVISRRTPWNIFIPVNQMEQFYVFVLYFPRVQEQAKQALITRGQEIFLAFPLGLFSEKKFHSYSSFWLVSDCTAPSLIRASYP